MSRKPSGTRSPRIDAAIAVRFWPHGDLWNGAVLDLPISVLGATLDEARVQLGHALVTYLALAA